MQISHSHSKQSMMKISFQRNLLFNQSMVTNVTHKQGKRIVTLNKENGLWKIKSLLEKELALIFSEKWELN